MESSFGNYLASPLFTFTVGAEKKEITVHSSALAELSESLNSLMNGGMIEAKTRHVDWSEVDVDTFVRLCEFAYFRNYTPPQIRLVEGRTSLKTIKSTKRKVRRKSRRSNVISDTPMAEPEPESEPAPEPAPEPTAEPLEPSDQSSPPGDTVCNDPEIMYKERSVWTGQLRDKFTRDLVIPGVESNPLEITFTPPQITGSWEDFNPVFLEQAKLYILADKYCIESLRQLVLYKLYQTLSSFKLFDTGVASIIELVRFVYSNTPPNYGGQVDALRNLVTRYVVSVLGQVGENQIFQELLEDGGPFVADFWRIIWSAEETTDI